MELLYRTRLSSSPDTWMLEAKGVMVMETVSHGALRSSLTKASAWGPVARGLMVTDTSSDTAGTTVRSSLTGAGVPLEVMSYQV